MITSLLFPKFNRLSCNFDGVNDYGVCAAHADLALYAYDQWTVAYWAKQASTTGAQQSLDFIHRTYKSTWILHNNLYAPYGIIAGFYCLGAPYNFGQFTCTPDTAWHRWAITNSGTGAASGMKVYRDGVELTTFTSMYNDTITNESKTDGAVRFGDITSGSGQSPFNGNMDEITLWNRVLTGAEATEDYNAGFAMNIFKHSAVADCTRWWRMGDGSTYPDIKDHRNGSVASGFKLVLTNMASSDIEGVVP